MMDGVIWSIASALVLGVQSLRPESSLSFVVGVLLGIPYFLQAQVAGDEKRPVSQVRMLKKLPILFGLVLFTLHRQINFKIYFIVAVVAVILSIVSFVYPKKWTRSRPSA